jgi:hypothetical protein
MSNAFKQSRFSSLSDEIKSNNDTKHKQNSNKTNNNNTNNKTHNNNKEKREPNENRSIFKEQTTSSRFDFKEELADMKNKKQMEDFHKKVQSELYDTPPPNAFQRLTFSERIQKERDQREKAKQEEKERIQKQIENSLFDVNSFPTLGSNTVTVTPHESHDKQIQSETEPETNYAAKVKWVPEEVEDKLKGLYLIGSENDNANENRRKQPVSAPPHVIMNKLVELYETWKANYIHLWGYDDYENNYKFPNYDYEYFDKLDYIYEMELLKLKEKEQEKQREADAEYYDDKYDIHYDD